jgi:tetratricopeptide (TPR) repeat protein
VEALRGSLTDELLGRLTPATRHDMARLFPEIVEGPAPAPSGREDGPRIFEAVACVLRDLAGTRPLVVVLEDLHWSDDMTLRLLKFLPRRLDGRPVLLVGTVRPEEIASAGERGALLEALRVDGSCAPRTLGPLSRDEATQLFRALLSSRDDGPQTALTERVWTLSEGNPFVVVECARAVRERAGAIAGGALALPEQVRALTARSFAGLGELAARLADVAAVIGRDFDVTVLRHASGLTEAEIADGIEELVRRRILREVGGRFDFTHDRVREVAHSRLLGPRRVLLHRQVARALEAAYADDLDAHCAAIGAHYHQAGAWPEASDYLARAGFQAWARGASREALVCFDDALRALAHLHPTNERRELAVRVRLAADAAHLASGHFDRGLALLREAEPLAEALPDRRWAGRVAAALGQAYRFAGAYDQARVFGQRALDIARETGDWRLEAEARLVLGQAEHWCANFRRAIEYLAPTLDDNTGSQSLTYLPALRPMARYNMALAHTCLGEFDAAMHLVDELFREDEVQAHPFGTPRLLGFLGLGFIHIWTGDGRAALDAWQGARAVYRDDCHRPWSPLITIGLGWAYAMTGRVAEGVEMLERSDAVTRAIGLTSGRANRLYLLAKGLILAGRLEDAAGVVSEARTVGREHGERHEEAQFHWLMAEVTRLREPEDRPEMERHLLEALPSSNALGRRPMAARCHLRLAWLYKQLGRPECEHHRAAARALLELMGGHFKLDPLDEEALG